MKILDAICTFISALHLLICILLGTVFCQAITIPQHNDVYRTADGQIEDILSDPAFNARTRVHEYGGGEYVVGKDAVYFSNFK